MCKSEVGCRLLIPTFVLVVGAFPPNAMQLLHETVAAAPMAAEKDWPSDLIFAWDPSAVLLEPETLMDKAPNPIAVLSFPPKFELKASLPTATLVEPEMLLNKLLFPKASLASPVTLLKSAP